MSAGYVENKVEEVVEILDRSGYWALVQRDLSAWGSVYILLCLPPISIHARPRKTPYLIRVADHPERADKTDTLLASIHPGQDDVQKMWRHAKATIRKDLAAQKQEAQAKIKNQSQYYAYKSMRKK